MSGLPLVEAIIVNHNTSMFSQLALRSLLASTAAGPAACRLHVTVVDNHSSDDELPRLRRLAGELGASFELSRWPADTAELNTHGDVLRDFVLARPEADLLLFVDCDIDFDIDATLQTMIAELDADPKLWAVQARFASLERADGDGASLDIWAGDPIEVTLTDWTWDSYALPVKGRIHPGCHPGATLIRNIPAFRQVAASFGLSPVVVMSADAGVAGFYDTLAIASLAMKTAGYDYALSDAVVHHFFSVSYGGSRVAAHIEDCRNRLERFDVSA